MTPALRTREQGYVRHGLFGVALVDGVTMEPVSQGVEIVADGLQGKPFPSYSGVFVWLGTDTTPLTKITIDPGTLPYQKVERERAQLEFPVTTIELAPRVDYPFAAGITGLRGSLVEERVDPPTPVRDASVYLRWLDDNGVWRDAPTVSSTDAKGGDFVTVLRLSPSDVPQVDAVGAITVRLRARRGADERGSPDLKLLQGRIADAVLFAWDELLP